MEATPTESRKQSDHGVVQLARMLCHLSSCTLRRSFLHPALVSGLVIFETKYEVDDAE